ncbi:kinase-like protein [Dendrothele bispora CBS 962.96]|uniref:Kinase-like protein n=1 Tax=Dendrothele bispora (strain CBS 962.96) TaxID=1314807 RepID=A0A4S8LV42_DENBC|nr:kinase-like protein [Dendrothele bispora CBS 962.96]
MQDIKFFVSPYAEHGCLMDYLKRVQWSKELGKETVGRGKGKEKPDYGLERELLGWMLEIAKGMEYLHSKRILHGDLKGANILIDRQFRCIIADFGHSKTLSQVDYTNAKHAHGFRWQSPELMAERSLLTKENDVYAFGITCVEILTMGSLPWPMIPDNLVRERVIDFDERPPYPVVLAERLGIRTLLESCWNKFASERPSFGEIVRRLETAEAAMR